MTVHKHRRLLERRRQAEERQAAYEALTPLQKLKRAERINPGSRESERLRKELRA